MEGNRTPQQLWIMGLDQMMHQNPDHAVVAGVFEVGTITIPHFVHVVKLLTYKIASIQVVCVCGRGGWGGGGGG